MVIEESLLLRGFETRICASLAKGGNKHRLKVLVGSGGATREDNVSTAINVSRILQPEKSRNRPLSSSTNMEVLCDVGP